eukprot:CAMPEP_0183708562 /NCGR_PEP_ID=MMETSP0737-20130205/4837_1 /TAXON_ID=385413 /ORGANISM="Thalassiosira miniscula, Strain CCMP1093" /LENGTH=1283 /DNA_ID=CAMNT_0025936455 /DNA_START=270 /DNA_END=4121 /DNA_ORIENTATION=-
MENVLAPPPPPPPQHGHVFSQEESSNHAAFSQSSRSVTNTLEVVEERLVRPKPQQQQHQNQQQFRPQCDNDNNAADDKAGVPGVENDEEEEEQNTQETFTQMTQGNELTQLCGDDDDDDNALTQEGSSDCHSPMPIDPLTLPWGRLMPVGLNNNNTDGGIAHPHHGGRMAGAQFSSAAAASRHSSSRGLEMLPRSPARAGSVTRSRSPSVGGSRDHNAAGGGGGGARSSSGGDYDNHCGGNHSNNPLSPPCIHFLGLKNLLPSDRFNEYVLGRSAKADVSAQKLDVPATIPTEMDEQTRQRNDAKRRRHDYVHAMISNRHCRIYCLLSNANGTNSNTNNSPPEMEVFVEDTSGNGTLVNGTTLLRRNERRKLHTGDVVCLLNPKLLAKKLRSTVERKMYMSQYSYVFVNLYEQEARHGWGAALGSGSKSGGARDLASPVSTAKKSAVNPRATKCHSINNAQSKRSLFAGKKAPAQQPSSRNNPSGLGSFLNKPSKPQTNNQPPHRRIEEEYDLRDLLGTGTCGEVRRAIHRRTGEERAVKIISIGGRGGAGPGMSSEKVSAIRAEADILRGLDHPYVVKLFDMYVAPGRAIYLVMELIRGGDLFDRIVERERYTEVQARRLFRRMLAAVHYLHEERGIVHRDLKPENILVVDRRSDVNVKLTDFGLAKNMTAEGLKTFCGTPQYFAPEVLRRRHTVKGSGRYGKEIDCWSIGVILFILLSGSPPFDVSAGFDAVADARVVFYEEQWRNISREARDLVARLLQKDPRRRMSVVDACRHKWVLKEDGDTHCHPLRDPVVARKGTSKGRLASDSAISGVKNGNAERLPSNVAKPSCGLRNVVNSNENMNKESIATKLPPKPASSPLRKVCGPVDPNALSPNSIHHKKNVAEKRKFQSLSAPQLSKDGRRPSVWPAHGNDKTVTKAIQQSCHTTRPSPNRSPIQKRQLFDKSAANNQIVRKTMTKQDMEFIKTAGNTLPKPVFHNEESRLVKKVAAPKKKVQSTLFPSDAGKQAKNPKPASQLPQKEDGSGSKRKSSTSTVTPPGNEQSNSSNNLVFRLNKKHKVGGKYISPEGRDSATATSAAPTGPATSKQTELPEDELQSDFSDDEGPAAADDKSPHKSKSDKNPIEKFLQKTKMESIESSSSIVGLVGEAPQQAKSEHIPKEDLPRPVSKESVESKHSPTVEENRSAQPRTGQTKDKKLVQSFLFGKPPPNGAAIEPEFSAASSNDGTTGTNGHNPSPAEIVRLDGGAEFQRQSSTDSNGVSAAAAAPKGKQRSIKNWFQPKK